MYFLNEFGKFPMVCRLIEWGMAIDFDLAGSGSL